MRNFIDIVENTLYEAGAGASRVVSHIKKGDPFFMISACRADKSPEENEKRTSVLRDNLAKLPGVSFIEAKGLYQEDGQPGPSSEDSFMVLTRSSNTNMKKFISVGKKLMSIFGQDSILVGNGETIDLCFKDGTEHSLGSIATFDPAKIGELEGHTSIKKTPFGFTTSDHAPQGVEYGSEKKTA